MKRKVFLILLAAAIFGFLLQGCQSQKEKEEAIQKEKMKKWGEDFTPEKYMEGKGKPQKPFWK
jgi:hypothetical protein